MVVTFLRRLACLLVVAALVVVATTHVISSSVAYADSGWQQEERSSSDRHHALACSHDRGTLCAVWCCAALAVATDEIEQDSKFPNTPQHPLVTRSVELITPSARSPPDRSFLA
jgi:hypothetical protein